MEVECSWYTDTDGFLDHSPSGRSLYYKWSTLQKIILVFWGPPSHIFEYKIPQDIWYITEYFLNILETEESASEVEEFPGIKNIKEIASNKINSLVVRGIMWTVFWLLNCFLY